MNRFLAITIDVEPDCSPNWRYSSPLRFDGISTGIAKRLQPLFNKYDSPPTYLINNVVLENEESCNVLKNLPGRFELATHLHPEFIEPEKTEYNYAGNKGEANCCFLPHHIEFEKIKTITELFKKRFNYSPVSFRAGRFSAESNTIISLERLGYKVDTSVTPHVNWSDKTREFPVDYRNASEQPYFIKPGTILEENKHGQILQVPVSISLRKTSLLEELRRTYFGIRHTVQSKRPLWLRPVFSDLKDFISIIEEYSARYKSHENIIFNMMFHNVEVMPGLSPYAQSESDCKKYLDLLEDFLVYCNKNNIRGATLADIYNIYR
jgi:hypothetical protein